VPYISRHERPHFAAAIAAAHGSLLTTHHVPGNLNYLISRIVDDYVHTVVKPGYADFAEVISTLAAVQMEFYRRVVVPYEEKKLEANGEVFEHGT
jgi:hypothetical protein